MPAESLRIADKTAGWQVEAFRTKVRKTAMPVKVFRITGSKARVAQVEMSVITEGRETRVVTRGREIQVIKDGDNFYPKR